MKKKIFTILILVIAMLAMTFGAYAEEQQADFYYNDKVQDIAINITYEVNDLTFTVISPTGEKITKDTETDDVAVSFGSTVTMILINDAAAGQWSIQFDKGSNETIGISAGAIATNFWITDYNVGAIVENQIPVDFAVSGDEGETYDYSIMLTTSNNTLDGKVLYESWATANEMQNIMVDMHDVNTYSSYYLMIYVSNDDGYFDYAYSDAFSYTNENAPEKLQNIDVTIYHDSQYVNLDWDEYVGYGLNSVIVEYSIDGEVQYDEEITDERNADYNYEEGAKVLSFKVYVEYDGLISEAYEFDVNLEDDDVIEFEFPNSGVVYSNIWSFDYEDADNTYVEFYVNEDRYEYDLDGSGSKFFNLSQDMNTITANYKDQKGVTHVYKRMANVSLVTPTLQLNKDINGVVTENDSIIIAGKTNATEVVINGETVSASDGIFTYKMPLVEGNNNIDITAKIGDKEAALNAVVVREAEAEEKGIISKEFPFWIIYLLVGVLISIAGIVLMVKVNKKKNPEPETEEQRIKREKKEAKKAKKAAKKAKKAAKKKKAEEKAAKKAKKAKKREAKLIKQGKLKKPNKFKKMIISLYSLMWIADIALWVWYVFRNKFENGKEFIHLAYDSLKEAKEYMNLTSTVFTIALALAIFNVAIVVIIVVIKIILKKRSKKQVNLSAPMQVPDYMKNMNIPGNNSGVEGNDTNKMN